ncbi:helix-turn-helix domain-containing protein [Streptomyces sp. NPDC088766]|uniref:AraC-like ligand-binding domain-containing protein n=1 Tax=Streptomyces sp. NPDC088766 TaxID=3365893 RepID=UPI003805CA52
MSLDSSVPTAGQLSDTFCTTESVPIRQRPAYWRAALSRTFAPVDVTFPDEVCRGSVRTSRLGRLRVATVDGGPLSVRRSPRLIGPDDDQLLVVTLLVAGVAGFEQDGREADLSPGEIVFCDTARPLRMTFPQPFRTKSLLLPRRLLGLDESDLRRLTAAPLRPDTTVGSLLAPFLGRLVDTAATYPPSTGEALARHVVDLLTVLVGERLHQERADASGESRTLLPRIQTFIDLHLADPDLTPDAIARAHRISVRYLHKLFQAEGVTVGRWIQRRRLQECRRELARREAAARTIAATARQWGFTSAAHFSRVFRDAYGLSPAEWRDFAARARRVPASPGAVSAAGDMGAVGGLSAVDAVGAVGDAPRGVEAAMA